MGRAGLYLQNVVMSLMPFPARLPHGRSMLQLLATAALVYWLAMTAVMHVPLTIEPAEPGVEIPTDKLVHFTLYCGLATLLLLLLEQRSLVHPESSPQTRVARYAAVFAFCMVHGYFEELTQPLTGRTYDLLDYLADGIGTTTGLAGCFFFGKHLPLRG